MNWDNPVFSISLALAETMAFIGMLLFTANLWKLKDYPKRTPPKSINTVSDHAPALDRLICVDIFIATYNEAEELVRLSIKDAKRVRYLHPININIYVLDDGRRPTMARVAQQERVNYLTRATNEGFKAGNLQNAMEQTYGDFIVICDADTRLFPTILNNTLGYFCDPDVAFVQTPQWFYDIPEGTTLPKYLSRFIGRSGNTIGRIIQACIGEVVIGRDPFVNDPKMFYDVLQRRRNSWNAAFCCGAASVHRRTAVMSVAIRAFGNTVTEDRARARLPGGKNAKKASEIRDYQKRREAVHNVALMPYKFHVSEDIYTSIILHQDRERRWKSVLHPDVESKMLSPQDLLTWVTQRFKYAGGSLDIFWHDNPITRPGLSLGQRLMYLSTFWSYLGALWNVVFLFAPIIYLFFAITPVDAYALDFFAHALPFLIANEIASVIGTWGLNTHREKKMFIASFPLSLKAIWYVLRGKPISFPVTPKFRQEANYLKIVWPQITMILLTISALTWGLTQYYSGDTRFSLGGILANGFWAVSNICALFLIVRASYWRPETER